MLQGLIGSAHTVVVWLLQMATLATACSSIPLITNTMRSSHTTLQAYTELQIRPLSSPIYITM